MGSLHRGKDQKKEKLKKKNLQYYKKTREHGSRKIHKYNLEKCNSQLKIFSEKNSINDFDKAAEDLRLATRYLGRVVGDVDVEEVLGKIFNDFCIGK